MISLSLFLSLSLSIITCIQSYPHYFIHSCPNSAIEAAFHKRSPALNNLGFWIFEHSHGPLAGRAAPEGAQADACRPKEPQLLRVRRNLPSIRQHYERHVRLRAMQVASRMNEWTNEWMNGGGGGVKPVVVRPSRVRTWSGCLIWSLSWIVWERERRDERLTICKNRSNWNLSFLLFYFYYYFFLLFFFLFCFPTLSSTFGLLALSTVIFYASCSSGQSLSTRPHSHQT